ncbi:MAG: hypothetical protein JXB38_20210 [Anaerolineales bacterium]|nr:hypothetical protein [Anaerolineales bacterium]
MASSSPRAPQPRSSLVWPVILVGVGLLFLLSNLGVLAKDIWLPLLRLWPLALILVGVEILVGRRSPATSTLAALLIIALVGGLVAALVFFPENPAVQSLSSPGQELKEDYVHYELGAIETAFIRIQWNPGRGTLRALSSESPYVLAGRLNYLDALDTEIKESNGKRVGIALAADENSSFSFDFLNTNWSNSLWDLGLHPGVVYELHMNTGSGDFDFDLSGLEFSEIQLESGSGPVNLVLPPGNYPLIVTGGSGSLEITIPETEPIRLEVDRGSGTLDLVPSVSLVDGTTDGDGIWETHGYEHTNGITILLEMGSGNVTLSR